MKLLNTYFKHFKVFMYVHLRLFVEYVSSYQKKTPFHSIFEKPYSYLQRDKLYTYIYTKYFLLIFQ